MSRVRKKRENQVYIKDVDEWMATVGKPGLLVAELYAPHFGPCETMFPVIDEIMTSLDNVDRGDEVRWAIVNVSKLEDDKAAANAEDALKRQETKATKDKERAEMGAEEQQPATPEAEPEDDDPVGEVHMDTTIPYLEKYSGFCHPAPMYIFFRNGRVLEELRGANPPKLEELVRQMIDQKDEPAPVVEPAISIQTTRRGSMSLEAPGDEPEPDNEPESQTEGMAGADGPPLPTEPTPDDTTVAPPAEHPGVPPQDQQVSSPDQPIATPEVGPEVPPQEQPGAPPAAAQDPPPTATAAEANGPIADPGSEPKHAEAGNAVAAAPEPMPGSAPTETTTVLPNEPSAIA
ncbi:Thioredoxin domain-containing protein [Plasmodiophora brassicae]|uniref:Thioredoxin domain-containing protein n=1 Tax=Plasmodiophora brassicae TaxID=37360 RepID=A0A0G4J6R2_PLABS|nr:hypothetical protein PBRA_002952 [Plasmodiophora brassicae]SPQ95434.1 unnamed protein product [Plasmodiophora brassicae]